MRVPAVKSVRIYFVEKFYPAEGDQNAGTFSRHIIAAQRDTDLDIDTPEFVMDKLKAFYPLDTIGSVVLPYWPHFLADVDGACYVDVALD